MFKVFKTALYIKIQVNANKTEASGGCKLKADIYGTCCLKALHTKDDKCHKHLFNMSILQCNK